MTIRDKSQDRFPGAPRDDAASPADVDALAEQEEMARLMKTLRESIPYHGDEPYPGDEPSPALGASARESAYRVSPEFAPPAAEADGSAGQNGSDEDDFARLLRTLREGIPDDPEPLEALDEPTAYDPHRYEPPEDGPGPYAPFDAPYDPSPLPPAAEANYAPAAEPNYDYEEESEPATYRAGALDQDEETEEPETYDDPDSFEEPERFAPAEAPFEAAEPAAGADDSGHEHEDEAAPAPSSYHHPGDDLRAEPHHPLDVSPGEQAVIADLLRSIQEVDPRHDSSGSGESRAQSLSSAAIDAIEKRAASALEFDEEERSERGQVWKIALALGGAATLGLAIALVNPFGDKAPPQAPTRVVVPLPPPPAPRPSSQVAEIKPLVVPPPPVPALREEPHSPVVLARDVWR